MKRYANQRVEGTFPYSRHTDIQPLVVSHWYQKVPGKEILFVPSTSRGEYIFDSGNDFNHGSNRINKERLQKIIEDQETTYSTGYSSFIEADKPFEFETLMIGQEAEIVSIARPVIDRYFGSNTKVLKLHDAIKSSETKFDITIENLIDTRGNYIFIPLVVNTHAFSGEIGEYNPERQNEATLSYYKLVIITDIPQQNLLKFSRCRTYLSYLYKLVVNGANINTLFNPSSTKLSHNENLNKLLPTDELRNKLDALVVKNSNIFNKQLAEIKIANDVKKSKEYSTLTRDVEKLNKVQKVISDLNTDIFNYQHYNRRNDTSIRDLQQKIAIYEGHIKSCRTSIEQTQLNTVHNNSQIAICSTDIASNQSVLAEVKKTLNEKLQIILKTTELNTNTQLRERLLESNVEILDITLKDDIGSFDFNDPELRQRLLSPSAFINKISFRLLKPVKLKVYNFEVSRKDPKTENTLVGPVKFDITKNNKGSAPVITVSYTGSDTHPIVFNDAGNLAYHTLHPHCQTVTVNKKDPAGLANIKQNGCPGELTPTLNKGLDSLDIFSIINIVLGWFTSTNLVDSWAAVSYKFVTPINDLTSTEVEKRILVTSENTFEFVNKLVYMTKDTAATTLINHKNKCYFIQNDTVTKLDSKKDLQNKLTELINDGWTDVNLISKYVSYYDADRHMCFEDLAIKTIELIQKESK